MERLTQKHDFFDYVLPEQNVVGDNQATEISLGETEYTCKKYIIGEAINKLGELEDVLEKYSIESVEKLEDYLTPKLFCYAKLSENLDELKKYYQCEPIIHIDTCEPQVELITDKIKDLEQELAELKQTAIVPKFKIGDKVYAIIDTFAYTDVFPVEIRDTYLLYEVWDGEDTTKQHFTRIFATKEEAEAKLQQMKGNNYE